MKIKVTRKMLLLSNNLNKYENIISKNRVKSIYKVYEQLAKDIESTFNKSITSEFKDKVNEIVETKFKNNLQSVLININKINIDEFVDYFIKFFNRTINLDEIRSIKSKTLDKVLKKYVGKTVENITNTTKDILNKKITEYTQKGLTFNDMVKRIVSDTKGEIGLNRAKIISRTETAKAVGETNYITAKKAKLTKKTWIHSGGGKYDRKSHLELHGITIGINEYFDVGAEGKTPSVKMRFPKDPLCNSVGHIIHCYCQVFYS